MYGKSLVIWTNRISKSGGVDVDVNMDVNMGVQTEPISQLVEDSITIRTYRFGDRYLLHPILRLI